MPLNPFTSQVNPFLENGSLHAELETRHRIMNYDWMNIRIMMSFAWLGVTDFLWKVAASRAKGHLKLRTNIEIQEIQGVFCKKKFFLFLLKSRKPMKTWPVCLTATDKNDKFSTHTHVFLEFLPITNQHEYVSWPKYSLTWPCYRLKVSER